VAQKRSLLAERLSPLPPPRVLMAPSVFPLQDRVSRDQALQKSPSSSPPSVWPLYLGPLVTLRLRPSADSHYTTQPLRVCVLGMELGFFSFPLGPSFPLGRIRPREVIYPPSPPPPFVVFFSLFPLPPSRLDSSTKSALRRSVRVLTPTFPFFASSLRGHSVEIFPLVYQDFHACISPA